MPSSKVEFSFYFQQNNPLLRRLLSKQGFHYYLNSTVLAEELGYKAVFLPDHFMLPENTTLFEPWTTLSALASRTERIRLASLVTPIPFYPPHILAKRVAIVDIISQGRVIFGAGCGWYQREFDAYQTPFYTFKRRLRQSLEGLELMKRLWTVEGPVTYEGSFYQLKEAEFSPKPHQKPHPPIWFGGGSLSLLRAVAEQGQGWIPYEMPPEMLGERLGRLKEWVREAERSLEDLTIAVAARTVIAVSEEGVKQTMRSLSLKRDSFGPDGRISRILCGTPEEISIQVQEYVDVGVNHICIGIQPPERLLEGLNLFWEEVASNL